MVDAGTTWSRLQLSEHSLVLLIVHFLGDHICIFFLSFHHRGHCWYGHVRITALLADQALLTGSAPMGRLEHRVLSCLLILPLELQQGRV